MAWGYIGFRETSWLTIQRAEIRVWALGLGLGNFMRVHRLRGSVRHNLFILVLNTPQPQY